MQTKHLEKRISTPLPVLEVTVLDGESYEQAIIRIKKAQQQELETKQESTCAS
jgi:hypothetical protein